MDKEMTLKYVALTLWVSLIFGLLLIGSVRAAPDITAYNNSISDTTLYPHQQVNTNIQFNVAANETITTWTWLKDGIDVSNNFDNYTTQWSSPGQKNITVSGTNTNGTTPTVTWNPLIEQEMAGFGDAITELNLTAYNSIIDVIGSDNPDYEAFLFALTMPHTSIIGSLFYVILYGTPFLFIWIGQGSAKIPAVLGCMLAPVLLGAFNPDYIGISVLFILLTLFGLIYTLYKERGT